LFNFKINCHNWTKDLQLFRIDECNLSEWYVTIVDIKMRLLIRLASKAYFTLRCDIRSVKFQVCPKFRAPNSTLIMNSLSSSIVSKVFAFGRLFLLIRPTRKKCKCVKSGLRGDQRLLKLHPKQMFVKLSLEHCLTFLWKWGEAHLAGTTYVGVSFVYSDPTLPTIRVCLRFGHLCRYRSAATTAFFRHRWPIHEKYGHLLIIWVIIVHNQLLAKLSRQSWQFSEQCNRRLMINVLNFF
jgi:hypothetical protein